MADRTTRNIMSLCAGVGGLELGISLALHHRGEAARGIVFVEREIAAAASLAASMESGWLHPAPVWSDLLTFDARPWRGLVHILASGDPCQDNSVAGKRAGADGERFLAPEVCRIAEECRPDIIFRENVPGNAGGQLAAIVPPLERLGYRVAAGIFSSAETGNTMRRERLFIMAQRESGGCGECGQAAWSGRVGHADSGGEGLSMAITDGGRGGDRGLQRGGELGFQPQGDGDGRGVAELVQPEDDNRRRGERRAEEGARQDGERRRGLAGAGVGMDTAVNVARADGARSTARIPAEAGSPSRNTAVALDDRGGLDGQLLPPAVIPGPTDSRWRDVLDRFPEYQPALSAEEAQSHLRRGVDAMAHRIERLRATGNGVDPVVAAYAFLSLGALLAGGE